MTKIDYTKTVKVRGHKKPMSLRDSYADTGNMRAWWRVHYPHITKQQHFDFAKKAKAQLDKLEKEWMKIADSEVMRIDNRHWFVYDYKVSGIGRYDFSEAAKDKLRAIIREETNLKVIIYAHLSMLPKADRLIITK